MQRCQKTFYVFKIYVHMLRTLIMLLFSNKMEGQHRKKKKIVFCIHDIGGITSEVLPLISLSESLYDMQYRRVEKGRREEGRG